MKFLLLWAFRGITVFAQAMALNIAITVGHADPVSWMYWALFIYSWIFLFIIELCIVEERPQLEIYLFTCYLPLLSMLSIFIDTFVDISTLATIYLIGLPLVFVEVLVLRTFDGRWRTSLAWLRERITEGARRLA